MAGSGCLVGDGGGWVEVLFKCNPCWEIIVEELVVDIEIGDGGVVLWFLFVWLHKDGLL